MPSEPTITALEGTGPFIACTACGPAKQRIHVSSEGVYQVTCLNCKSGAHLRRQHHPSAGRMPLEPSIDDRGDWECAECGPGKPKQLVGAHLHCMLCGDQCRVRPAVIAALRHAMREVRQELMSGEVRGRPPARNSCHNRPDKTPPYFAQDGYFPTSVCIDPSTGTMSRTPRYVEVHHVMSTDCRYDKRGTDAKCDGCRHR